MKTSIKLTLHSKCKFIVSKFCAKSESLSWPKQIKLAKQLLEARPEFSFWETFDLKNKIFCLSWFLTSDGQEALSIHEKKLKLDLAPIKQHTILTDKIGEDLSIRSKPKTLFEFIKYGKN